MLRKGIVSILILFVFFGCEKSVNVDLRNLQAVIRKKPDSVMTRLYAMDTLRLNQREKSLRRVLLSQCHGLCHTKISNDSLIAPALDYFENYGDDVERGMAWFYYSETQQKAGNIDGAVEALLKALDSMMCSPQADYASQYLVVIYYNLGTLYYSQGYCDEAIDYLDKAIDLAKKTQWNDLLADCVFMKSQVLYSTKKYDQAIQGLESVKDSFAKDEMSSWVDLVILNYKVTFDSVPAAQLLEERKKIDFAEISRMGTVAGNREWSDTPEFLFNAVSSMIFLKNGLTDSASVYIQKAISQKSATSSYNAGIWSIASSIYGEKGDTQSAFDYYKLYKSAMDSIQESERDVQVKHLEQKYHQEYSLQLEAARHRHHVQLLLLLLILLTVCACFAIAAYKRKVREKDRQLNDYLTLLDSYKQTHSTLLSKLHSTDEREMAVRKFLNDRFSMIREIASTYYTYGDSKNIVERMKQLALSAQMLEDVVQMSDFYNDYAVTRLKKEFPDFTARNYDFMALVIAGFSAQEISVLLDMSLNGVYSLKSKLKRRIAESQSKEREFLVSFFN